jgi:sulfur carrier protein ThiS
MVIRWRELLVKLEIKLFAGLICKNEGLPSSGQNEFVLDAPVGITVKGLHELLKLGPVPLVTVVNGVVEKKDFAISGPARIGIFPPIAGGMESQPCG